MISFLFYPINNYIILFYMIKNFDEYFNEDIRLNESEQKAVNEAVDIIVDKIKSGEDMDEGFFGSLAGGITGLTIGPAIGKAICKALGITSGLLYNLFTSRVFTTAVATYIGYKQ